MIIQNNLQRYRHGEFVAFISNTLSIVSKAAPAQLGLQSVAARMQEAFGPLKANYKVERGNKVTRSLIELDKERDNYFVALRIITGQHAVAHPDPSLQPRAQELLDVMEQHGIDLYRKSYQEQTAGIDSVVRSAEAQPELMATLSDLHLSVYFEAMKEANTAFDEAYLQRNSQYAKLPKEKLVDLRGEVEDIYGELVQQINAHLVLAEDKAPYQRLADEHNTLIESYREVIERRLSSPGQPEEPREALDADYEEVQE